MIFPSFNPCSLCSFENVQARRFFELRLSLQRAHFSRKTATLPLILVFLTCIFHARQALSCGAVFGPPESMISCASSATFDSWSSSDFSFSSLAAFSAIFFRAIAMSMSSQFKQAPPPVIRKKGPAFFTVARRSCLALVPGTVRVLTRERGAESCDSLRFKYFLPWRANLNPRSSSFWTDS